MPIPWIGAAAGDQFFTTVSDEGEGGIFPLSFRGQAVVGQQNAVRHGHIAISYTVGAKIFDAVGSLGGLFVLAIEVSLSAEEAVVHLSCGVVHEETFADHDLLVDTVGPPLAELIGLQPGHAHNGVIAISGVTQVVVDIRLIVSTRVTPHEGVGLCPVHDFWETIAVDAVQPKQVFQPIEIGDLHLVHVEGADGDTAWDVVPSTGQVIFDLTHGKRTSLDKNKARAGLLSNVWELLESTIFRVIVRPARGA